MKLVCLLPLAGLLLAVGCKKDPIKTLPKATQAGKNKMGCLVDGKAWEPIGSNGGIVGNAGVEPIFALWQRSRAGGGDFSLSFRRRPDSGSNSNLSFFVPALAQAATFSLDQVANPGNGSSNPAYAQYTLVSESPERRYRTGPDAAGTLLFTRFDTVAGIASGTFTFTARHAASGQIVQVTEGRFDVRFTKR